MTDSPDEPRDEPEEATETSAGGEGVPRDVDWDVVAQAHVDPAEPDGLTVAIVEAVADAEDVQPMAVLDPPLYDSVDTVELAATLFGGDAGVDVGPAAGSIEFMYRGFRIVVRRDGWVLVHEPGDR